jgi:predicted enzyme related to lactoylglutathione lyase
MSTTTAQAVWFEVPATDSGRARQFYGGLFGWEFERFGDVDYHTTEQGRGAISGMADGDGLLTYFGVDDVGAAVARVRELGGESGEPEQIPGVGVYAHCRDTEGNRFGLFQAPGGS